ncbi:MAG: peptidase [Candidatus Micrarchaeota archaeon]|nr:peptidase [Candidatus Micrarchaeota archaeon]
MPAKTIKTNKPDVARRLRKLVPVKINCSRSNLSERDTFLIKKLIEASKIINEVFLVQVYNKNKELKCELSESKDKNDKLRLQYFLWNAGPWDRLNGNEPFIGHIKKRPGVEFYPSDMKKKEFEVWLTSHTKDSELFRSDRTVIRRKGNRLIAIPYSKEYRVLLEPVAKLLKEAARITDNLSLRKFLLSRAEALLSNNYLQSEFDWMNLDSKIELTLGPYEVYEDKLFGYKASFESFVTVKDEKESEKLQTYVGHLAEIDKNLPIDKKFRFTHKQQKTSPISVAIEVFAGGEADSGYRIPAFNLPNDHKIREVKGSKKVLLKNIIEAKFNKIDLHVAKMIVHKSQLPYVTSEVYFNSLLFHELSHGIGPAQVILKNGLKAPINELLRELRSAIDEAMADVSGVYLALYFIDKGILPKVMERQVYPTYMNTIIRDARFGILESHAKGSMVEYNYLHEKGAIVYDASSGKFGVDYKIIRATLKELLSALLNILAEGSYEKAKIFLDEYAYIPPELKKSYKRLSKVPTDIYPIFEF